MRTQQGTDFVSLLYAKQILMQKQITIDTQFLERAEGSLSKFTLQDAFDVIYHQVISSFWK